MDNQDQGKNHSSGHESHGVYLCHKCGWPFPNAHPSAKHRRSHKKICGTIEGYKLVDSGDVTHSTASDDEQLSDEDHKTQSTQVPKVVERCGLEKNIGGIGAISSRSEDEVFSDASMEFQDSSFGLGRQDSLDNASKADKMGEKDLTATISFKDCEDTEIVQPPWSLADKSQEESSVVKNMPILSMGAPEHQDVGLGYSKDSEDKNGSAGDVLPIEMETPKEVSEESREVCAGGRVAECAVGQATDANENEEGKLNKNLSGGLILPSEHAGEISKTVSISEKRLDVTSDMGLTDNMVQLEEEFSNRLASKTSMTENGEQETDGKGNPGSNLERKTMDIVASNTEDASVTSEKTQAITSETGLADKIVELKENSDKLALNKVIHDLSSKADYAKDMDSSTDTFQIQTDAQGTYSAFAVNSSEVYDKKERENESFYVLSIPDDIPVVDDAEAKLEGFKDHERVKLHQLEALASKEIIIDKEDEVRDRVSQDKSDTFLSKQLDEDIKVDPLYMHTAEDSNKLGGNNEAMVKEVVVEDNYKLGGNNEAMVKEVLVEGKADVLQINKGSDALSPIDEDATENEKDQKACSFEKQHPVYVADDIRLTGFSGNVISGLPDVKPMVEHTDVEASKLNNVVGIDDMIVSERAETGVFDINGGDNSKRINGEDYVKNTVSSRESTSSSLFHTNPASYLHEVDNSDDIGTIKSEKYDISVVESRDGPEERYISIKTNSTSESISTHHQSPVITEEVNETEGLHLDRVSNCQDDIKESETSRDNMVQGECAGKDLMASAVDNSGGNEFEKTSVGQLKKDDIKESETSRDTMVQGECAAKDLMASAVDNSGGNEFEKTSVDQLKNDDIKESETSRDNTVQRECAGKDLTASAVDNSGGNEFEKTSVDQLKKELILSPSYPEPSSQSSGAVYDSHTREPGASASGTSAVILQGEADNGFVKPQLDTTVGDVSIESSSQTDSVEGHWGSVSVLSTQSDNPAGIDTETLPSTGSHALSEAEKANIKKSKVASEEHVDKSEEFEPPSFMTLVETGCGDQKASVSEIQTVQNAENPKASPLKAGWFPSLTHVANESPGRKKNEEIIEKVTNWNVKQHTPLKNLLGEANSETKPKSPTSKENRAVVIPTEEKATKDNGASVTKVSSILGSETPVAEPTHMDAGKEWNSPARYPTDIKREKRKVKGRPLWVQFVCCSSVN
ncbi:hypothetical protein DITRI_Ditri15bG0045800 [Diplodiscus trichospermus]